MQNEHLRNDKRGWHDKRRWIPAFAGMPILSVTPRASFCPRGLLLIENEIPQMQNEHLRNDQNGWHDRTIPLSSPCPFLSSPGLTGGSMRLCQRNRFPIDTFGNDGKSWIPDQVENDKRGRGNDLFCHTEAR